MLSNPRVSVRNVNYARFNCDVPSNTKHRKMRDVLASGIFQGVNVYTRVRTPPSVDISFFALGLFFDLLSARQILNISVSRPAVLGSVSL